MRIAIIGLGFVGGTIFRAFSNLSVGTTLVVIDPAKGHDATYESIENFDAVFVCVPSPKGEDGTANTKILRSVLKKLASVKFSGIIISKVTAPPDEYQELEKTYPNLVHAPEFLTAANAYEDYINGTFAIIGSSNEELSRKAEDIIRQSQPKLTSVKYCSIAEASFSKYVINSFLATKVVFMNEMAEIAKVNGMDWKNIVGAISQDVRLGGSHMQVPGPDGKYGFGGMCFPKDTVALLKYAEKSEILPSVLDIAVDKNTIIRLTNHL